MKKGQIVEGIIEGMEFPNKGFFHQDEKKIIVKGALPGQKIKAALKKTKGGRIEGRLLEILERSPLQNEETACPHGEFCGGCLYQGFPYEEQLRLKEEQIRSL